MVSTVWAVSFLSFSTHVLPPCPAIFESGDTCPVESAPVRVDLKILICSHLPHIGLHLYHVESSRCPNKGFCGCLKRLYDKSSLRSVESRGRGREVVVPDSMSICTEGSVAEVSACPTVDSSAVASVPRQYRSSLP